MSTIIADNPPNDGQEWENQCARCGSSMEWVECTNCDEDGFVGHDCGEDCCCCADPEPNITCEACGGKGGWWRCISSREWCLENPRDGREKTDRGEVEWYVVRSDTPDASEGK